MIITARARDIGGFNVRRLLPYASHRMVGPFIFFDHMGPAKFSPGHGMDVRPHPHINLATVTYLFEGVIQHRDSLGSNQWIEPGAVNWMTAGRGIVHSERTPQKYRNSGATMNGIQLWVALPKEHEEIAPSFSHHPKESLPEFKIQSIEAKLLLGSAFGYTSPVPVLSDLCYLEIKMPRGSQFKMPLESRELAYYLVQGKTFCQQQEIESHSMYVHETNEDLSISAIEDSHIMVIGGKPVGERFIFWNFVSSSKERIEEAKRDWLQGPRIQSQRFQKIPGDDTEFIPLPNH